MSAESPARLFTKHPFSIRFRATRRDGVFAVAG